jgi:RND superfamily putative drug exporter
VVSGRWWVLTAWAVVVLLATLVLPTDGGGGRGSVGELLPADSEAAEVAERSLGHFRVPVLSDTSVVVHDPDGLSPLTQADVALWALVHTQPSLRGEAPTGRGRIVAAVPIPTSTPETAVTYLYVTSGTTLRQTVALAEEYAAHFENQATVRTHVTGLVPAQVRQAYHLESRLHLFEVATLVLIAVIVGLAFRSLIAPLVVLLTAGVGYVVASEVLASLATVFGFALPEQLQPLIAALLIGVVTDYCVLFFSGFRRQLERGVPHLEAARRTVASEGPIVTVAGITVAAGTAALLATDFQLFRAFGPALSLTVVVGLFVSLTLVPALMAVLGHWLFLPRRIQVTATDPASPARPGRLVRLVVSRRGATLALLACGAVLIPATIPLSTMRLDMSFTSGLPADDPVRLGAQVLDDSGVRGVVGPTEVLVEGEDVTEQRAALIRLQELIEVQVGVAEVLGPAQNPLPEELGIFFAADGDAARFVVVLDTDPLGAVAIADLRRLQDALPVLLEQADVQDATVAVSGQTAIASELAQVTRENLWRALFAALLVELIILSMYLRALVTPVLLLLGSTLAVGAALGLSVLVFQGIRGDPGLIFFAPFATVVLLIALGSDYNVFAVGSIWEEAARHPLRKAIAIAMPATARAIGAAGVILAASFGMVAIIDLESFRQIAFTMVVGLLIDTFIIRPVFTPAVLTLLGPAAGWPSRRTRLKVSADPGPVRSRPAAPAGERPAVHGAGAG